MRFRRAEISRDKVPVTGLLSALQRLDTRCGEGVCKLIGNAFGHRPALTQLPRDGSFGQDERCGTHRYPALRGDWGSPNRILLAFRRRLPVAFRG